MVNPTTLDLHLSWDVPYQPGVLRAVGKHRDGTACAQDEVHTAGRPAAIRLRADHDTITTDPWDVANVTFEVVDSAGTVVPTDSTVVHFTVTGGTLLALDNANLQDHDPYRSESRRAFEGRGLAILRAPERGRLRVTADADGLRGASLIIVVRQGSGPEAIPAAR